MYNFCLFVLKPHSHHFAYFQALDIFVFSVHSGEKTKAWKSVSISKPPFYHLKNGVITEPTFPVW